MQTRIPKCVTGEMGQCGDEMKGSAWNREDMRGSVLLIVGAYNAAIHGTVPGSTRTTSRYKNQVAP